MECSNAARATPTAPIAVPGRVWSRVRIAILKPSPSSPSRFAAGTFTSWKASAEVSVARWPILSRCFSTVTPSASGRDDERGEALLPLALVGGREDDDPGRVAGVRDEHLGAVEDVLVARRIAVVWMPETSDPAFGSVSANEQSSGSSISCGSHARFCSSVPARRTGAEPSVFATSVTAIPEQPQESSSPIRIPSKIESPGPPSSSGRWTFIRPERVRLLDDVRRVRLVLVVLGRLGPDLLGREVVGERLEVALLLGQGERNARLRAFARLRSRQSQ